ncbi:unnamed protein product [Effrenium voratum]|nr:unnamed protein product [Effrenium voratum]
MEDERVFDFNLVSRMTFLEYMPVCQPRRSASVPGRLNRGVPASSANHRSLAHCMPRPEGRILPEGTPRSGPGYAKAGSNETLASTAETASTLGSLEDAETESPPQDREPEESVGSSMHPQRCRPCAWFWQEAGCARGAACLHCHMCLPGELVRRRKQNRAMAKTKPPPLPKRLRRPAVPLTAGRVDRHPRLFSPSASSGDRIQ